MICCRCGSEGVLFDIFYGFCASLDAIGSPKGTLWEPRGGQKGQKMRSRRVSKYAWYPMWAPRAPRGGPGVTFEWIWDGFGVDLGMYWGSYLSGFW